MGSMEWLQSVLWWRSSYTFQSLCQLWRWIFLGLLRKEGGIWALQHICEWMRRLSTLTSITIWVCIRRKFHFYWFSHRTVSDWYSYYSFSLQIAQNAWQTFWNFFRKIYKISSCLQSCPRFTAWSAWSACSVSCGRGLRSRQRTCEGGIPGRRIECTGDSSESEDCIEGVRAWSCLLQYKVRRGWLRNFLITGFLTHLCW